MTRQTKHRFAEGSGLSTGEAVAFPQRARNSNAENPTDPLMGAQTVKTNLSSVYAKLDVANRTKLAALVPPAD